MAKQSLLAVAWRRLLGLTYLAVIISLVLLSVAIYQKKFTKVVLVTLMTDHTGNQLITESDVKERGIIVGSVRAVHSHGNGAIVTLALQPDRVGIIPQNVSAQVLPKTLFGEQYVALTIPAVPQQPIRAGDVIAQDRSAGALETEKVLGDMLPLLRALHPAELNATLTAMAQALDHRGTALGNSFTQFDAYLQQMNATVSPGKTYTTALVDDLVKLGQVALEYNNAAPDIIATLNNLQVSNQTLISRQAAFDTLLGTAASTSDLYESFLADNEQRLITVAGTADKVYGLLQEYSPEFACTLEAFSLLENKVSLGISNNQIHLSATMDTQPANLGPYTPGQQPRLVTGIGPNCFGLPDNAPNPFPTPAVFQCLNDGAPMTTQPCSQNASAAYRQQAIGSRAETAMVDALIASTYGTTPNNVPAVAAVLAAPALRGSQVSVK